MESILPRELTSVKAGFESWRAQRKGRERIPEQLWQSAIALLDYYPFHKVRKELNLNTKQFKERANTNGKVAKQRLSGSTAKPNFSAPPAFLEIAANSLTKALPLSNNAELSQASGQTCRVIFERADGSRLSLHLPVEWQQIQAICRNFSGS
jgi:hypothetical protein